MAARKKCEACGRELPVRKGRGRPQLHCADDADGNAVDDCRRFAAAVVTVQRLAHRVVANAGSAHRGRAVSRVTKTVQSIELPTRSG